MSNDVLAVLSALFMLTLGNYAFTWQVYREVQRILTNHLHHVDERLEALESGGRRDQLEDADTRARLNALERHNNGA